VPELTISELQTSEAIMKKVERETRKLRMGCGEPLNSTLCYATPTRAEMIKELGRPKGGLFARLLRFLTRPQQL
jgi:hypothetical protein